jgi:arylsulfatase A-like enzyme
MPRRVGSWVCLCILTLLLGGVDCRGATKPNIVLITIDALRADRTGPMSGHGTPNLDRLARDGISFLHAYSQAPLTIASHATILTGTYPQVHRASEFAVPLAADLPYLPSLLQHAGYKTAAFVGSIELDPRNGPLQGYDRGFDFYDASFHQQKAGETRFQSVNRRADDVVAAAIKWLGAHKHSPFFLWVNLSDGEAASGVAYDRALLATDAAVGKLIASLKAQALYETTALLAASPYGASLGAHGEEMHGMFLYDETVHVPLVVKLPNNKLANRQVKNRVSLVDVAPTLVETAGVSVPPKMQGQSLLRVAQSSSQMDQPAYSRTDLPAYGFHCSPIESWRAGKYLYIRAPKPELYDLTSDSGAAHNLAGTSKAILDTMASQLQAFDRRIGTGSSGDSQASLTSSEMQKLASLGYVGLQKAGGAVNAGTEGADPKDFISSANKTFSARLDVEDGKAEKAMAELRGSAQADSYLAQYTLGAALFLQQKFSDAIPYLHKAIELQPESPWAHYSMGVSLMKTGDFKTAAVHLEIAASRLQRLSAVHAALAESYEHLGRTQEAARERASTTGDRNHND